MRGDKLLQIDGMAGARKREELHLARLRARVQHPVKNGADQQYPKSIQESNRRQEEHRGHELPPIRSYVSYEAGQLPHRRLPMRSRARLAAEEIGISRKPLFYCSRWRSVVGRWPATLRSATALHSPCVLCVLCLLCGPRFDLD